MTYQETLDFLFNALPMFQRQGAPAFKKDLSNTLALCDHLRNPEKKFKSIHVAGTNGKGSTSHSLAAILQKAGYKTGLYTSPHLKSFTERIKIDGIEIPEDEVVQFVKENKTFIENLKPSFFEMTVAMAFWHFAKESVDVAVIEVGMGGKFDSTNVILPEISVITNIGFDHVQFLGNTLPEIAGEKAGIIKQRIPVVISQTQVETKPVFIQKAQSVSASIKFADESWQIKKAGVSEGLVTYEVIHKEEISHLNFGLLGNYQRFNLPGILETVHQLKKSGWEISEIALKEGLEKVASLTGLKGRWQVLETQPMTICDTGHNIAGFTEILDQLKEYEYDALWMVLGMVQDKDVSEVLSKLPKEAHFVFCEAKIPRALPASELAKKALDYELKGQIVPEVNEALTFARKNAGKNDLIFIGGSTFVVAEIDEL
ncbi:bifunctional folylpolyglutamate synthase/dihydrofolate synthase [Algoriphagus machipongonensis]|uniref:Dihydrofolate synthase/folylpolyglutamate synthase n=1 Tax=Algoriphagus machipongonensis TaxID=388413 RepID=A3HTE9_9BACT|nr:folylpolyglutamate synthase/dihydrofolate synthase family protein [Algoriphagus machipongonensis]EAZ83117.1 tetrahydrofolate synthase [Algoriphagus machipongonensis]